MNNTISFAIDCDEVLRQLCPKIIEVYNKEFNKNASFNDIYDYKLETVFPDIQQSTGLTASEFFFSNHAEELFLNSIPYNNTVEAINILKNIGKIYIVTYQKKENIQLTIDWLDKFNIYYDGICFIKDKTKIHCTYLIDDNDWNFINCNCNHGILINKPYNINTNINNLLSQSNCIDINRFNSLYDFALSLI